jgi:hypothetical protein
MSAEQLAAIAGVILSLVFSYIPGLSDLFAKLDPTKKRLVMGLMLLIVAGAAFGLSCGNVITAITCDKQGALGLINVLIMALVANQSVYQITKKS